MKWKTYKLLPLPLLFLTYTATYAQKAQQAAQEFESQIKGLTSTVVNITMIICGLCALVAALIIFYYLAAGKQESMGKAAGFFGALLFITVVLYVIQKVFFN